SQSVNVPPINRSSSAAIRSASSTDEPRFPSCTTGSQRRPIPDRPGESIRCRSHARTEWSRPSYEVSEMKRHTSARIRHVREQKYVFVRLGEMRLVPRGRHERPVVRVALLQPAEREPLLARGRLDLGDEVVDRLMTRRRYADAPAETHQPDDQLRAGVGLAGSGRGQPGPISNRRPQPHCLRAAAAAKADAKSDLSDRLESVPRLSATDAARSFSELLNRVLDGEEIEITRAGAPVAVIGPPRARFLSAERFR